MRECGTKGRWGFAFLSARVSQVVKATFAVLQHPPADFAVSITYSGAWLALLLASVAQELARWLAAWPYVALKNNNAPRPSLQWWP